MTVLCFFNNVQIVEKPYEVNSNAPHIELPMELAGNICSQLLEAGVIKSYCIPALTDHAVKFNV